MRTPGHRRPRRRDVDHAPPVDVQAVAVETRYVGSAEHKSYPSPAGPPRLRADATKCDPLRHGDLSVLTDWLREAIAGGAVGAPWEGRFPRYAWAERDGVWYEARLVNAEQGTYKGYELLASEVPRGVGHA